MRVCEIAQHRIAQMACQCGVLVDRSFGRPALVAHHDNVIHRLGRIRTLAAAVDTKTIAAEAEFGNVASAIGEKLADADRPRDDLVPAIGPIALGIDLVIAREAEPSTDALQRYQRVELTRLRDSNAIVPELDKPIPVVGIAKLSVHDA